VLQELTLKETSVDEIQKVINQLARKKLLTQEEIMLIDVKTLLNVLLIPEFGNLIRGASMIKKETEFYMLLGTAQNLKDRVEVQGIVDLLIEKDDKLILIDYKTGKLNKESAVQKYKKQLDLYKKALEEGIGKKVKEVYIYSLYLNKEILL
jgi:ATP-dependent helicase/nuclease subunit A